MTYVPDPGDLEIVYDAAGVYQVDAGAILTALAAAGRLLPTGDWQEVSERRWIIDPREIPTATGLLEIEQTRRHFVGPWVAVDEGSGTA